jgi:CHAT domain-containing protein
VSDRESDGRPTLQLGQPPLHLPRVVADVAADCARCCAASTHRLVVAGDWWDREALSHQHRHAAGLTCQHCGAALELPVPLVQRRSLDAVELLVGLPASTPAELDREWIRAVVSLLRPYLSSSPTVVTVRASWWTSVDTIPLGPALAGLTDLPDLPEPPEERRLWLDATRASLQLPDVLAAVARFVTAATVREARHVVDDEPALLDARWRATIELTGSRLLELQETDEQRETVEQRLSRLRQISTNLEPDAAATDLPVQVQKAVDGAVGLPDTSPQRVPALEAAVTALRPLGRSRMLGAALTSLLATRMTDPSRSPADVPALLQLADEAIEVCRGVFGDSHEATVTNCMNALVLQQDRSDLATDDLRAVCDQYEQLAGHDGVRRSGHLVDILNNLATAMNARADLSRGERQELVLQLFQDTEHIARLSRPWDTRTIVLALVNQAAILRQRLTGARLVNAENAWALLAEAQLLDQEQSVLHTGERVQMRTNSLNVAFRLYSLGSTRISPEDLVAAARAAAAGASELHADNETALTTLVNTAAVLVDVYTGTVRASHPRPELLTDAEELLTSASQRAEELYPVGHRTRLTAMLNLASVYGAPTGTGGVVDAQRCAELLNRVAEEAANHSLDHEATARTNLGTLWVGQGRWENAAVAYAAARSARARLIDQTAGRHTRLGEVIATGDLAVREALAYARLDRAEQAVATLEDSRANLLRHRRGLLTADPVRRPGRAVVHLGSCSLGTLGVVDAYGQPTRSFIDALPGSVIRDALHALVTAPSRLARLLAFDTVADTLARLVDTVSGLLPATTTELCVVACGPLAGAPLHAITSSQGTTWTDQWPVRYWPSASVAASRGEPRTAPIDRAVAVANPTHDLPLAATELDAIRAIARHTATAPDGWSTSTWLRNELPHADLAHFACHGRADLINPTGSYFELGDDERLCVEDLLDGPDLTNLELVVASACQAGVPAAEAPDELLGIGYGLVHAGAAAAITTLWEINDAPASLLIARLYAELRAGHHPGMALRLAQIWLAGLDNARLARLCTERLNGTADDLDWLPAQLATALARHERGADPAERPFRHPADWGAFTYLGG